MIDMHLEYDNMHKNEIIYVLIFYNNHIITNKIACYQGADALESIIIG